MPLLELYLFSAPHCLIDGAPIQGFATRKAEALLIYLAVTQQIHRRDSLTALFWPEMGEKHARNNLRRTLSNLRKLVGSHLRIDRYTVAFDKQSPYRLDVEQFEALMSPLRTAKTRAAAPVATLEEALALYRADFLAGFMVQDAPHFDEWVQLKGQQLHGLAVHGLEQLTTLYMQQHDFEAALRTTQRQLALEPWLEPAHQQSMRLLALTGRRTSALAQFEICCKVMAEEFGVEPQPETVALYHQIKAGLLADEQHPSAPSTVALVTEPAAPLVQLDQGEMPRPTAFHGRFEEVRQLKQWLLVDGCALVTILGSGGSGKTTLAAKLIRDLVAPALHADPKNSGQVSSAPTAAFSHIIWRSLLNAPPLTIVLAQWLELLSAHQQTSLPTTLPEQLTLLFSHFRRQRCLLVLDNFESLLAAEETAGTFRPGYEEYGLLIQRMGEMEHQSCLLLTSREQPLQAARLERNYPLIRTLTLPGLPPEPGIRLLQTAGLAGSVAELAMLIARYSGNPLALNLIAETVQDFYGGDVAEFLAENPLVFADIRQVLDEQFQRLSTLERELLFWLAITREPLAVDQLYPRFIDPPTKGRLIEALRSLQRRSLLETVDYSTVSHEQSDQRDRLAFTLQNVVTEYLTNHLNDRFFQELTSPTSDQLHYIHRYGLVNAQAKEYIRATQRRLLLEPLAQRLAARWGKSGVEAHLNQILHSLHAASPAPRGFAAANLLHLWLALGITPTDRDFSHLQVREADLRGVRMSRVNFASADLTGTVFSEIFNAVLAVAFSPDGRLLAVAGTDGMVRLWHIATLHLIGVCPGNGRWVWSVAFSPNGEFLATGCADRVVRLWSIAGANRHDWAIAERQVHRLLLGHTDAVFAVRFHPDGKQLASASADGAVRIWHVQSGELLHTLTGHTAAVNAIAYAPDGATLASGGRDGDVRLWCVANGQPLRLWQGHRDEVKSITFHPDGHLLATAGYDQAIHLWYTATGDCYRTLQSDAAELLCVAFHPDGRTLAANERDDAIRLWEIESGSIVRTLIGHTGAVHTFAYSPDGQRLVSGSWDRTLRFWDARSGDALYTMQGYRNEIESITLSNCLHGDHHYLANGNTDHLILLWDIERGEQRQALQGHTGAVNAVAFHPNGGRLVSGGADQTLRLWQIDDRQSRLLQTLWGHTGEITEVVFSPNGDLFASAGADQTIRIWRTDTGEMQQILRGHVSRINALAFCCIAPTQTLLLVSGDDESHLYGWGIAQADDCAAPIVDRAQPVYRLSAPPNGIHALAFSPDGCLLAAGGAESMIQLWSMPDRRPLYKLQGHSSSIYGLAFSLDGKCLASGSGDQTIALWDPHTGERLQTLSGHTGVVQSVLFHPNGRRLISSSSDETIKIWDIQSGACLHTLRPAGLYKGMNISNAAGLTAAQRATLKALGAVDQPMAIEQTA
ncbi:MAG: BTAD domain-containing putative transcriptional regulator [Caldilineaceae bacterium]